MRNKWERIKRKDEFGNEGWNHIGEESVIFERQHKNELFQHRMQKESKSVTTIGTMDCR